MIVLAYLGPETMLPMTSVLAAAAGFVMMFGRKVLDVARALFTRKTAGDSTPTARPTRARGNRPTGSRDMAPTSTTKVDETDAR